jgi:hypothetical protein
MRQVGKGRRLAVLLFVAVAGMAAAGIAYAVVPDANGVIHGCYDTKTGALRVIDSDQGQTCVNKEAALNWNQTGPQGPQGPQGAQGPQGPAGPGVAAVANIAPDGTVGDARGLTQANVHKAGTGIYCIGSLSFQPVIAVGNGKIGFPGGTFTGIDTVVSTRVAVPQPGVTLAGCDSFPDTQVEVMTYSTSAQSLADSRFEISLEN